MEKKFDRKNWETPRMKFEDYDENYPLVFAKLSDKIHSALPGVRIEHVGSTSVPRLGGRGVLDIVVISLDPQDSEQIRIKLLEIGFKDFPYPYLKPMLTCSIEYDGRSYSVLLYVLPENHEFLKGWLVFREYMRSHPEELEEYEKVKKAAIDSGHSDPRRYQEAKTPYLQELAKRMAQSTKKK
jgi:GrpB-like predicted nucleotidyltransferase (UPF0157 family)